jgi:hypothetical protein
MRVPFIKYIESLVVARRSYEEIFQIVKELDVAMSSLFQKEDILHVCSVFWNSHPEYFKEPTALPDPEWLDKIGVKKMVAYLMKLEIPEGTIGIPGAFEILKDFNMYQTMSSLALASVTEEDIELIVNAKYNIHYGPEDIKEFLHYFFNVDDWTISEKRDYVKLVTDNRLKRYYDLALEGDKDYLIWKLGISPEKSFDAMLREMGSDCYYNFKEKMKAIPEEAQKWGALALRIVDRLEKLNDSKEEKKSILEEIEFSLKGKLLKNTSDEIKNDLGIPLISEAEPPKQIEEKPLHLDDLLKDGEVAFEK